jgi:secondary thiamine-phosphate synthase enzyme
MIEQHQMEVHTSGRGTLEITSNARKLVRASGIATGLCNLFVHHTSASLILCENADSTVRTDLETFMARLVPDGDPSYRHDMEGPDDMPAHIRSILTQTSVNIPIIRGDLALGTWQGVYLWEQRHRGHHRRITVTLQGEND